MVQQLIFYVLAAAIAVCSILAVATRHIIRSATYLLVVLLATAGLYLLLQFHFLMAVQIAVYAGGVMVLFIFGIMLTHKPGEKLQHEKIGRRITAALAAVAGLGICGTLIYSNVTRIYNYVETGEMPVKDLGLALMGTDKYEYLLVFELISILLLACIVGAVMIARKRK